MSSINDEFVRLQEIMGIAEFGRPFSLGGFTATLDQEGFVAFNMVGKPCRLPVRAFVRFVSR